MARRRGVVLGFSIPEDTRPVGTVAWGDPSTAHTMTDIHTFNEPHSPGSKGEQRGFQATFGHQSPWSQTADGNAAWSSMNRKRGTADEDEG